MFVSKGPRSSMLDIILSRFKNRKMMDKPSLRHATVINLLTLKGGVGKTTIAFEISKFLAQKSFKVLAIDLDPQANLSLALTQLSFDEIETQKCLYDVLFHHQSLDHSILRTSFHVDLIPSTSLNSLINQTKSMDYILKSKEIFQYLRQSYDYILIDSNPTTSISHAVSILNSDIILSPIYIDAFSLQGLKKTFADVKDICKKFKHSVQHKVIFNRISSTDSLSVEKAEQIRSILPEDSWLGSFSNWNLEKSDPQLEKEIGRMIQFLMPQKTRPHTIEAFTHE